MRVDTKRRKKARRGFEDLFGRDDMRNRMLHILQIGKHGLDTFMMDMGCLLAEAIMDMEREERSGPDYAPLVPGTYKWAYQKGSVYCGDCKVRIRKPRLRGPEGEISLSSYEAMRRRGPFSEELLDKALRGLSERRYRETVLSTAVAFGVSPSSVSGHIVEVTANKLREFKARDLSGLSVFALYIDTVHRAGEAFLVALGIDREGRKHVLGFWQGATENHEICEELFMDMERRGLILSKKILFVTDGGSGIIKALKDRFGRKLLHQRCAIHKDRNIQRHLPKKYRKEAHRKFTIALEQESYDDARQMLQDFEKWLRSINESAADSLLEATEEILTTHKLRVPRSLRKTLMSTNPIENIFSTVRDCEHNIKRYRGSTMSQRWLASVFLFCEKGFRKIKGCSHIDALIEAIEQEQEEQPLSMRAVA
jgi:transposase-like protein